MAMDRLVREVRFLALSLFHRPRPHGRRTVDVKDLLELAPEFRIGLQLFLVASALVEVDKPVARAFWCSIDCSVDEHVQRHVRTTPSN